MYVPQQSALGDSFTYPISEEPGSGLTCTVAQGVESGHEMQ